LRRRKNKNKLLIEFRPIAITSDISKYNSHESKKQEKFSFWAYKIKKKKKKKTKKKKTKKKKKKRKINTTPERNQH
jgi:hypothetical protein